MKKGLCQFLDIPIIYHCAKNQKKLCSHFWEKCLTGWQTDGQTDKSDFIGPTIWWESKNNHHHLYLHLCVGMPEKSKHITIYDTINLLNRSLITINAWLRHWRQSCFYYYLTNSCQREFRLSLNNSNAEYSSQCS